MDMGWRGRWPRLTPESGELLHLDLLRFVASVGVVLCHSGEFLVARGPVRQAAAGDIKGATPGVIRNLAPPRLARLFSLRDLRSDDLGQRQSRQATQAPAALNGGTCGYHLNVDMRCRSYSANLVQAASQAIDQMSSLAQSRSRGSQYARCFG